jgi:hypothetical protein
MSLLAPAILFPAAGGASGNFTFSLITTYGEPDPVADPSFTEATALVDNDMCFCVVSERSGLGHANHAVTDNNSSTWTKIIGYDNVIGDANGRYSASVWYYEATGVETDTTPVISPEADSTNPDAENTAYQYFRCRPSATYAWTLSGTAANGSGTSDWDGLGSGNATATGDDIFELATATCRQGADMPTTGNI